MSKGSPRASVGLEKNKEINRGFSFWPLKIIGFCPKSENFAETQGINSDFCG